MPRRSGSKKSLTWSVSSQPWHAGDKLMLRIETAPEIAVSGLESSIAQGRSDSFTVSATNLASTNSYTIRVTTDSARIGFNNSCSTVSKDVTVPAGSASHTAALDLHGCTAPGGTLTAKLLQGSTTLDTATAQRDCHTFTRPPLAGFTHRFPARELLRQPRSRVRFVSRLTYTPCARGACINFVGGPNERRGVPCGLPEHDDQHGQPQGIAPTCAWPTKLVQHRARG